MPTNVPPAVTAGTKAASPAQQEKLDALLNRYTAGNMTEKEYIAARDKIISGGK